jgi:hypothetical protein
MSRIWGGIHPPVDDFGGRRAGSLVGKGVWTLVQKYFKYFDGSITNNPVALAIRPLDAGRSELRLSTTRGFHYKIQSTPNLETPFEDEPGGSERAQDSILLRTNLHSGPARFFRALP